MNPTGQGRTAITRSVSLDPKTVEKINARLERLHPRVKGFSHYVQLLIERDISLAAEDPERAGEVEGWCAMKGSNLRPPPCQGAGKENLDMAKIHRADVDKIDDVLPAFGQVLSLQGLGHKSPLFVLPIAA